MPSPSFPTVAVVVGGLLLAGLSACGSDRSPDTYLERPTVDAAMASLGDLEIRNAKIQPPAAGEAELAVGDDATATLAVVNMGEAPDRLLSVTTAAATGVELLNADDTVVERIDVPPLGALGPNDFRIRLRGLTRALRPGQHVEMTVTFTRAGRQVLIVPLEVYTSPVPRPTYDVFEHHEGEESTGGEGGAEGVAEG